MSSTGGVDIDIVIEIYYLESEQWQWKADIEFSISAETLQFVADADTTYYVKVYEYYGTNTGDYAIIFTVPAP